MQVQTIGRILPLLAPWDAPLYVTRSWCLFELFTAIKNGRDVQIDIIVPPSQRVAFTNAMAAGNYTILEQALDKISSTNATASEAADLAAIQGFIQNLPGKFDALDETVRNHLRHWFEAHGAVLSSSRVQALRRSLGSRSGSTSGSQTGVSPFAAVARTGSVEDSTDNAIGQNIGESGETEGLYMDILPSHTNEHFELDVVNSQGTRDDRENIVGLGESQL